MIKGYNFTDALPKEWAFINLNNTLSADRRAFLTNGLRSYFKDNLTILLDRKEIHDAIVGNLKMF
jgi:hypothetical protein